MLLKLSQIILLVITLLLHSCSSQHFYTPEESIQLQFNDGKQAKAAIIYNPVIENEYLSLQAGYSPIKHLAIAVSHFNIKRKDLLRFGNQYNTHYRFHKIAVGGYAEIDLNFGRTKSLLMDFYGGIGQGRYLVTNLDNYGAYSIIHRKYSFQAGLHLNRKHSALSFIWQTGIVNYRKGLFYGKLPTRDFTFYSDIANNPTYQLRESTLQYSLGGKAIKGYMFATKVNNYDDINYNLSFRIGPKYFRFFGIAGAGIRFNLSKLYKDIKN